MNLRIHTLGPFRAYQDDTPVSDDAWKTQKNKALFKILLTHRGHALTTDQLMEWLWPDLNPEAAGRNLRIAVSQLRRALEPNLSRGAQSSYVLTAESGYAWNTEADYWLDAEEFEARCSEFKVDVQAEGFERQIANAERAKALYRGDYLEEDRYEDWAIAKRERFQEMYFALLTRLAEAHARRGRYRRAIPLCREVLAQDRCRESVWCQLMLYYYHAGDQALALAAYQECRQVLAKELGGEPLPETAALAEQIRHREVTGDRPYPPPAVIERLRQLAISLSQTPFVGREVEYAWLVDHLKQSSEGRGRFISIEGEAGIGKTRLAEEVVEYARKQGATVLESCCQETGGTLPYQPITEVLRSILSVQRITFDDLAPTWLVAMAELLPELRQTYPDLPDNPPLLPKQEKMRLFEALAQFLLAILRKSDVRDEQIGKFANTRLLLVFLDDLQWADASTLEFLGYFATRLAHEPVLVLGAYRSEEVATDEEDPLAQLLWTLKRQRVLHRLVLEPLSSEAVVQLLQEMSGSLEQGSLLGQRIYHETEGNPLFLLSVLQALFEDGLLMADETGAWSAEIADVLQLDTGAMPPTMHRVILRRLGRLSDEERQALEAAAVLGREFQWPVLSRMRARRRDVLLDHLDHLMKALLIREHRHERYIFTHDKIRQVVYEGIPEEQRGWLHVKAGEAMESVHAERVEEVASTLAYHFQQAGQPDRAFTYLLQAGWHAARLYANAEAIDHYRAALALVGQRGFQPTDEALQEVHERLGDLYQIAGRYASARKAFEAALDLPTTPASLIRLLYKLAHIIDRQGHSGPSRTVLSEAVQEVDRLGADQVGYLEAARVYARWAIMGSARHSRAEAERYARQAVSILGRHLPEALQGEIALPWAEYDSVHSVLINAGEALRHWRRWSEAADLFQQSLAAAERQGDPVGIGYSCHNQGDVVLAQGDFSGARALYERAAEAFARSGQTWEEIAARTHLGLAWACEGRWEEAAACLEQARTIGEGMEPTEWLAEIHLWLSLAELRCTGDQQQAQAYREQATSVAEAAGQALPPGVRHLALSAAEASAGKLEAARRHYAQVQALWEEDPGRAFYSRWILQQCEPLPLPNG